MHLHTFWKQKSHRLIILLCSICITSCEKSQHNQTGNDHNQSAAVTDYTGNLIELSSPARRIVALAPHLVENVFSAGAGEYLIAVVSHSDFPEQAKKLPLVGGYQQANLEAIMSYQPDLVLAWESGNSTTNINSLKELGLNVYVDRTDTMEGVAKTIRDIGVLAGTSKIAKPVSDNFLEQLETLRKQFEHKRKITTFYQVWNKPLRTINGKHTISASIELCGGTNIFSKLKPIAPVINIETIIEQNPEAIIASGMADERPDWLDDWKSWPNLQAVQNDALFFVHPDHIQRHTLRILKAARTICNQLDQLR